MLRIKRQVVAIGIGVVFCVGTMSETRAASTAPASPYQTPDTITPDDLPSIGYRYASLGSQERRSLRQSFKLPMEALAAADSVNDLLTAAIVQPLPDPSQPFLPVSSTDTDGDPFASDGAEEGRDTRLDTLGALGRLFAKEEALRGASASATSSPEYPPATTTSVAANPVTDNSVAVGNDPLESEEDPFADGSASTSPGSPDESADPFGSEEGDDFDDDPFGDF